MCMNPQLANRGTGCPIFSAKTLAGNCGAVLCSEPEATLVVIPDLVMVVPANTFTAGDVLFVQGLVRDASDSSGSQIAITNGVEIHITE